MPTKEELTERINQIAQDIYDGKYGDDPFEEGSDNWAQIMKDTYEQVGQYDLEGWDQNEFHPNPGGEIIEDVISKYDTILLNSDPEWVEQRLEDEHLNQKIPATPVTYDSFIMNTDDLQSAYTDIVKVNETKISEGQEPIALEKSTLDYLAENGMDTSAFAEINHDKDNQPDFWDDFFSGVPSGKQRDETTGDTSDKTDTSISEEPDKEHSDISAENTSSDLEADGKTNSSSDEDAGAPNTAIEMDNEENEIAMTEGSVDVPNEEIFRLEQDGDTVELKIDSDGKPVDIVMTDTEGNQTSVKDIFSGLVEDRPDLIKPLFEKICELNEKGEDWRDAFKEGIENISKELASETKQDDVEVEKDPRQHYLDRMDFHQNSIDLDRNVAQPYRRDCCIAYHKMAATYNAMKAGVTVNGAVPNVADVLVTALEFSQSDVLGTLIIYFIRDVIESFAEKIEIEQVSPIETKDVATDALGVQDNGFSETLTNDNETVKEVEVVRQSNPMAATCCGANMVERDKGSIDALTIRTTNPDHIDGKGISIPLTKTASIVTLPDLRLVDFKDTTFLVNAFGKVEAVISGDNVQVGETLKGLDITERGRGKEALESYCEINDVSADKAKDILSTAFLDRFSSRIEKNAEIESNVIRSVSIPKEESAVAELKQYSVSLERAENVVTSDMSMSSEDKEAMLSKIRESKEEVSQNIKDCSNRISDFISRYEKLDKMVEKGSQKITSERFTDAVDSEKTAIGRMVRPESIAVDVSKCKEIIEVTENIIEKRIEKYNDTVPEMDKLSFSSQFGFVDRYGINDKGEYVGKYMAEGEMGPMSATEEDIEKYLEEHIDNSRFDAVRDIIDGVDQTDASNVEKSEEDKIEVGESDLTEADTPDDSLPDKDVSTQDQTETNDNGTAKDEKADSADNEQPDKTDRDNKDQIDSEQLDKVDNETQIQSDTENNDVAVQPNEEDVEQNEEPNIELTESDSSDMVEDDAQLDLSQVGKDDSADDYENSIENTQEYKNEDDTAADAEDTDYNENDAKLIEDNEKTADVVASEENDDDDVEEVAEDVVAQDKSGTQEYIEQPEKEGEENVEKNKEDGDFAETDNDENIDVFEGMDAAVGEDVNDIDMHECRTLSDIKEALDDFFGQAQNSFDAPSYMDSLFDKLDDALQAGFGNISMDESDIYENGISLLSETLGSFITDNIDNDKISNENFVDFIKDLSVEFADIVDQPDDLLDSLVNALGDAGVDKITIDEIVDAVRSTDLDPDFVLDSLDVDGVNFNADHIDYKNDIEQEYNADVAYGIESTICTDMDGYIQTSFPDDAIEYVPDIEVPTSQEMENPESIEIEQETGSIELPPSNYEDFDCDISDV